MVVIELEGKNLGEKHRNYNETVKSFKKDVEHKLYDFNVDEDDVNNLIKIDIASDTRNIEYILKVLVCNDILYVSRAIKKCKWLFTEPDYAHIINAEYLHSVLFKQMNTRAVNKLKKCLKLQLKDSVRVQSFYKYESDSMNAVKWLPHCSTDFIEQNIHKHIEHLNISLLARLCEKTIKVLEIFIKDGNGHYSTKIVLESTMFLLNTNLNKYLDIVEQLPHNRPQFGKRATSFIMNNAPQRITEKYELYYDCIHLKTFIKCLGSKNIKSFLCNQASRRESLYPAIFNRDSLQMFIENMPKDERLDFIQQIFIDEVHKQKNLLSDSEKKAISYIYNCAEHGYNSEPFLWFNSSFETCFEYMKKYLQSENRPRNRKRMFSTIIIKAKGNQENLNMLMKYFFQNYNAASVDLKDHFIKNVTTQTHFHRFDEATWNIMENIMDKNKDHIELYAEILLIYKVLNDHEVSNIIYTDIDFSKLKTFKKLLSEREKKKLFEFMYNYLITKLEADNIITKLEVFENTVEVLEKCLGLLNDWDKNLRDYPFLIDSINNLIKVKKQNQWTKDMSNIYNINKSWKKDLFHLSLDLCPRECVLINSIKHDAGLIEKYHQELDNLRITDSITRFLNIIRIYWSNSIAKEWINFYFKNLYILKGQKISAFGICVLLPRMELQKLISEHAPKSPKIDYNDFDELKINLQRNFARIMHHARPQPPLQTVLLYARGDYLQYALPALLSIIHNLSFNEGNKQILNLVDTQVSLQKHMIRLAFLKLNTAELSTLFTNIWQTTQNSTLRTVLFKSLHDLLCKENDQIKVNHLWKLLETFIDSLNFNENKIIYDLLLQVKKVHISIRPEYFCKSYYFLKQLVESDVKHKALRDQIEYNIILYVTEIIELLPSQVVSEIVLEFINNEFKIAKEHFYNFCLKTDIVSAYLLCANDESTQLQKYNAILRPLLQNCKTEPNMRNNLDMLLKKLREGLKSFIVDKKMIVPIKMFELIQRDLEEYFNISENYLMLTQWKLTVAFTNLLYGHQIDDWDEICQKISPQFVVLCHEYLKENCQTYFSRVYILFSNVLNTIIDDLKIQNISWDIFYILVDDVKFVEGYLAAIKLYPDYIDHSSEDQAKKLRQIIFEHPSTEVKMHYYEKFNKNILS